MFANKKLGLKSKPGTEFATSHLSLTPTFLKIDPNLIDRILNPSSPFVKSEPFKSSDVSFKKEMTLIFSNILCTYFYENTIKFSLGSLFHVPFTTKRQLCIYMLLHLKVLHVPLGIINYEHSLLVWNSKAICPFPCLSIRCISRHRLLKPIKIKKLR